MINFALFAWGFPAAQGVYCADHIGPVMAKDQGHRGATPAYKVRVSDKPCRVCEALGDET